jgi:hypothetical protein
VPNQSGFYLIESFANTEVHSVKGQNHIKLYYMNYQEWATQSNTTSPNCFSVQYALFTHGLMVLI